MRRDGTPNPEDAPSDGYGTGFVIYVLRQSGMPADAEPIRRGIGWLKTHQRAADDGIPAPRPSNTTTT